jgi:hypothetical protein
MIVPILILVASAFQASPIFHVALTAAPSSTFLGIPPESAPDVAFPEIHPGDSAPQCEVKGAKEVTISCTYTASPPNSTDERNAARIVLNRAVIAFEPIHESDMRVELEFANGSGGDLRVSSQVFLAIDDELGRNMIRRLLPHVDLASLHPGDRHTFTEKFLVGAFVGGNYTISLWIPDPDPSRKNTAAYNLLLSSTGVPNSASGLNILAHFPVAPAMHSSREK